MSTPGPGRPCSPTSRQTPRCTARRCPAIWAATRRSRRRARRPLARRAWPRPSSTRGAGRWRSRRPTGRIPSTSGERIGIMSSQMVDYNNPYATDNAYPGQLMWIDFNSTASAMSNNGLQVPVKGTAYGYVATGDTKKAAGFPNWSADGNTIVYVSAACPNPGQSNPSGPAGSGCGTQDGRLATRARRHLPGSLQQQGGWHGDRRCRARPVRRWTSTTRRSRPTRASWRTRRSPAPATCTRTSRPSCTSPHSVTRRAPARTRRR